MIYLVALILTLFETYFEISQHKQWYPNTILESFSNMPRIKPLLLFQNLGQKNRGI